MPKYNYGWQRDSILMGKINVTWTCPCRGLGYCSSQGKVGNTFPLGCATSAAPPWLPACCWHLPSLSHNVNSSYRELGSSRRRCTAQWKCVTTLGMNNIPQSPSQCLLAHAEYNEAWSLDSLLPRSLIFYQWWTMLIIWIITFYVEWCMIENDCYLGKFYFQISILPILLNNIGFELSQKTG